jgi:Zn finger protein HypA/HybF involved in hydrogenase expression
MTHPTDGNTYAIERELAAQEAHDAAQPVLVYCLACNETISSEDWPNHEYQGTCPNCASELEKTS